MKNMIENTHKRTYSRRGIRRRHTHGRGYEEGIPKEGHLHRGYIHMKEQIYGGDIQREGKYTGRGHSRGWDIYTEGIYTRRGYTRGGDIHAKRIYK